MHRLAHHSSSMACGEPSSPVWCMLKMCLHARVCVDVAQTLPLELMICVIQRQRSLARVTWSGGCSWVPQPFKPKLSLELIEATLFLESCLVTEHSHVVFRPYRIEFSDEGQIVNHVAQLPHIVLYLEFCLLAVVDVVLNTLCQPATAHRQSVSLLCFCWRRNTLLCPHPEKWDLSLNLQLLRHNLAHSCH